MDRWIDLYFFVQHWVFLWLFPAALRDPMTMERTNLLNMAKLSIKGLIESGLSFGRTLDSDYPPLQQFFVVMEHCLKHGLKGEKGRQRKQMQKKKFHSRLSLFSFPQRPLPLFGVQSRSPFWASTSLCGAPWSWWRNCVLKQRRSPPQSETCRDWSKEDTCTAQACKHGGTHIWNLAPQDLILSSHKRQ